MWTQHLLSISSFCPRRSLARTVSSYFPIRETRPRALMALLAFEFCTQLLRVGRPRQGLTHPKVALVSRALLRPVTPIAWDPQSRGLDYRTQGSGASPSASLSTTIPSESQISYFLRDRGQPYSPSHCLRRRPHPWHLADFYGNSEGAAVPILQRRKLRPRYMKRVAQGHTDSKGQS